MAIRVYFGLFIMVCMLAACGNSTLSTLRRAEPNGTLFQQKLQQYYLTFAQDEQDYGRDSISQYVADKGLRTAYGETVATESLRSGAQYHGYAEELRKARIAFELINTPHHRKHLADDTAKTQSLFDCWVLRADEDAPTEQIEFCQQSFYNAFTLLTHKSDRKLYHSVVQHSDTSHPELSTSYLIYFDWDKASLSEIARNNLKAIAQALKNITEPFTLALNGHTDTSGSEQYNRALSERRAGTIQHWLSAFGISDKIITVFAFGESDPLVKTPDGVKEEKNRRVEIFIE